MIIGRKDSADVRALYKKRSEKALDFALLEIRKSDIATYVKSIYLFGSCARNEQSYGSDVDLLIELDPSFDSVERKNLMISELRGRLYASQASLPEIEAKFVVGDDWKSDNSLFYKNIRREGKKVW